MFQNNVPNAGILGSKYLVVITENLVSDSSEAFEILFYHRETFFGVKTATAQVFNNSIHGAATQTNGFHFVEVLKPSLVNENLHGDYTSAL